MSFENFPYTDFHELNLDWIIKIVKECKTLSGETAVGLKELKEYVNQYFDDLNVQQQINNKLDAMAADGSLAEIINQEIFADLNQEIANTAESVKQLNDRYFTITYFKMYDTGLAALIDFYDGNGGHKYALYDGGTNTNSAYPFYYATVAGHPNDAETVYNGIVAKGVTHLDYAFVSHFHNDHVGALGYAIQNGMIDSTSKIYIAGYIDSNRINNSSGGFTESLNMQSQMQGLTTQYNLTVIPLTTTTKLDINGTKLDFLNVSDSYDYIYTLNPDNTNFFSGVTTLSLGTQRHMIASDITPEIQSHIQPDCKKVDVLQTPHHASDKILSDSFADTVNPEIFVNSYGALVQAVCSKSAWLPKIRELGAKCYLTMENDVTIKHNIYGYTVTNPAPENIIKTAYCDGYFKPNFAGTGETTLPVVATQNNASLFDVDVDSGIFTCKKPGYYIAIANYNIVCSKQSEPFKIWASIYEGDNLVKGMSQHLTYDYVWANVASAFYLNAGEKIHFAFESGAESTNFTVSTNVNGNTFKIILLN